MACTSTLPCFCAASRAGRLDSGSVKAIVIGSSWVMVVSEVLGCTRLPGYTAMPPTRPDIGARIAV
jgi:hypothetical protein